MTQEEMLKKALGLLRDYVYKLGEAVGISEDECENIWERIASNSGVLQEFSYFHDYNTFLGQYGVEGFTIPDIVAWQVDHFKAYMDRDDKNRFNNERLLLESFDIMAKMAVDPAPYIEKMAAESGQDF